MDRARNTRRRRRGSDAAPRHRVLGPGAPPTIARRADAYEHISPELVGNGTRFVVSEMAGKATIKIKADELGLIRSEHCGGPG